MESQENLENKKSVLDRDLGEITFEQIGYLLGRIGRGLDKTGRVIADASYAVTGGIARSAKTTRDYVAEKGKSILKWGLLTAAGVVCGYVFVDNYTDRLKPDYDPNQVTAVLERKLDGKDYDIVSQQIGINTKFKRTEKGFRRLDDLFRQKLNKIDSGYQAEVKKVEAKYNAMEVRAEALK